MTPIAENKNMATLMEKLNRNPRKVDVQLCAHGCGMWHGWKYPNCVEALDAAIRHRFKNIEVDVSVTKDGAFVVGQDDRNIAELDQNVFLKRPMDGGGTRMTLDDLIAQMAKAQNVRVMIDFHPGWRKDRPDELRTLASRLLATGHADRFLLEAYSEQDASSILETEFRNVILWLGNRFRRFEPVVRIVQHKTDFCLANGIRFVSLDKKNLAKAIDSIRRLKESGVSIWSSGWSSRGELAWAESLGVDVATVDSVLPGSLVCERLWLVGQLGYRVAHKWRNKTTRLFVRKPPHGRRVFLVGVFDLLHFGHFELFRRAKALAGPGGVLTVAVQDDDFVLKYKPTANIVVPLEKRIAMIETLRTVDRVVIYTDVDEIVKELDFDVFVVGGDQTHAGFQRAIDWCKENGREVVRLSRTPGVSSSELRQGIAERR